MGFRFEAEITFLNPSDLPAITAALAEHGYDLTINWDVFDEYGPSLFGRVTGWADDEDSFGFLLTKMNEIVYPFHGVVDSIGHDVGRACNTRDLMELRSGRK